MHPVCQSFAAIRTQAADDLQETEMAFGLWEASVPVFVNTLTDMRAWLDKAAADKDEAALLEARLAPDMRPLPAQYQMASDSAKNALARLTGTDAPAMPDTEQSFADLRERCDKTIAYLNGFDAASLAAKGAASSSSSPMAKATDGMALLT
jgi:hypothetical protein